MGEICLCVFNRMEPGKSTVWIIKYTDFVKTSKALGRFYPEYFKKKWGRRLTTPGMVIFDLSRSSLVQDHQSFCFLTASVAYFHKIDAIG